VVHAGTLEIEAPIDDQESGCERLVFDPTRLCDGIEESGDLILSARPRAYAVSATRRHRARG
jgi:catalase